MSVKNLNISDLGPPILNLQWGKLQNAFWRVVPLLMILAAFLPGILANLKTLSVGENLNYEFSFADGKFLQNSAKLIFGQIGPKLLAILPASAICFGIWACSRALGAKIWGASSTCALYIAASVFGIIPKFSNSLDDGFFAAFILLSATFMLKAIDKHSQIFMAVAFLFSVFAVLLRPFAAWPQIAVFIGIVVSTKHFEERPIYGLISALCWGPGLFSANMFAQIYQNDFEISRSKPLITNFIKKSETINLSNFTSLKEKFFEIFYFLISALPFAILGVLTLIAIISLFNRKSEDKNAKIIGFSIFLLIAIIGAFGYGQIDSARLLLDGLFLSAIGAISGANVDFGIKAWLSRFKFKRAVKT